jgi:hypothetical protein
VNSPARVRRELIDSHRNKPKQAQQQALWQSK